MKNKNRQRRFGGKTEGFLNKEEQRREEKHLKAYKKGHNRYISGYDLKGKPIYEPVIEIWE